MDQRLTFITIGVEDLDAQKKFYIEKLGWKPMLEQGDIIFFKVSGLVIGLFPASELAKDANIKSRHTGKAAFKSFSLSVNYNSEEEVDNAFEDLRSRSVSILKAPEKVFWGGYSGYFEDPEGNLWELAYNPFLKLDQNGAVTGYISE